VAQAARLHRDRCEKRAAFATYKLPAHRAGDFPAMNSQTNQEAIDTPFDASTRLAFERTFLAYERTQMAWVRTSLALISFGFAIAEFFHYVHEQRPEQVPLVRSGSLGILMILIGLVALAMASIQHGRALKALRAQCPGLPVSLGWVLAALLALLGVLALVVVMLRR
jgi:putative membrane protein